MVNDGWNDHFGRCVYTLRHRDSNRHSDIDRRYDQIRHDQRYRDGSIHNHLRKRRLLTCVNPDQSDRGMHTYCERDRCI